MAGAITAGNAIGQRDAILFNPHGTSYLYSRLFCRIYSADSTCRTDLRTLCAFGTAISAFVGTFGLHQCRQTAGGSQNLIGTNRYAKLTARTMSLHIAQTLCAGRNYACRTIRNLFVGNYRQTAVHLFLLRPDNRSGGKQSRERQKFSTGKIFHIFLICNGFCRRRCLLCRSIQCV